MKTSVKELRDILDELISKGKENYDVDFIIFLGGEGGHEISDSQIKLHNIDDEEKSVLLQGSVDY